VLVAAAGKERFYQKCGFELLVGYASQGVDAQGNQNPLAKKNIAGGAVMWTKVKADEEVMEGEEETEMTGELVGKSAEAALSV